MIILAPVAYLTRPKKKIFFTGDTQSEDGDLIVSREDLSKTEFYLCVMVKNVLKTEIKNM